MLWIQQKTFECVIALFLLLNNLIFKWCNWHGRYTVVYLLRFVSGIYVCCSIWLLFNFCTIYCSIEYFSFFSICFPFVWTLYDRLLYYLAIEQTTTIYTRVIQCISIFWQYIFFIQMSATQIILIVALLLFFFLIISNCPNGFYEIFWAVWCNWQHI